jgi:hypothetical protein
VAQTKAGASAPAPSTVSDPPAYTLRSFCAAHTISLPFLHKLRRLGLGPRVKEVGGRSIITGEDAAEWRRSGNIEIPRPAGTGRRGRKRGAS